MKNSKLNTGITKLALGASMCAALAACGGGSDGGSSSGSSTANESVTLNGQVTDGPIQAAGICLYADGQKASGAGGSPICATTQDDGTYTLSIPRKLASGFLTLVATKSGGIVLASTLGTTAQVLAAASDGKNISPGSLPDAIVTHLSTADFALAQAGFGNRARPGDGEWSAIRPMDCRSDPMAGDLGLRGWLLRSITMWPQNRVARLCSTGSRKPRRCPVFPPTVSAQFTAGRASLY